MTFKIHHKLALVLFIFAAAVSGITSAILYQAAHERVNQDIRQRLRDIAATARAAIDVAAHDRLASPDQEGSADYLAIRRALQAVRDGASDIHFIYTMRKGPAGAITFVVDAESNPEDVAHLGEVYEDASELLAGRFDTLDEPIVEHDVYTDQWGTWLSGYAPFFRADGSRAGVLGVDISAATVLQYRREFLLLSAKVFLFTLPVVLLAGLLLGRRLARPVVAMKDMAERFGSGDLEARVAVRGGDEVAVLGRTLNAMAQRLREGRDRLREMAEKYRAIFDNAVEGIFQTTPEGKVLTANQAMCRMLGYASFEEVSAAVTDLTTQVYADPADRAALVEALARDGAVRGLQARFRRKDGSILLVELSASRLAGKDGAPVIEGMVQDITERVEREAAERSRHAAEAASQAKSEFLANMSHEIRTPLNAIMGLSDLLRRTEVDPRQAGYLRKIQIASRSLLAVINDILDFSKIEAGKLELEEARFSLHGVMANLSEMFSAAAHEKDIELAVSIGADVPAALVGDPVRLGQVLINLVGNAIKFTSGGEVVVAVALAQGMDAGEGRSALEFSVADTGEGIAPERLAAIFDAFSQADGSITRRHGGTGLGLAICRRLVTLMGGEIAVQSEPGKGSRFTFTAVFGQQPADRQPRAMAPADLRGLRVLVVDDNATAREILAAAIASFRMEAVEAASGMEALDLLQSAERPFDLILMDWRMPGLNGIETARRIKRELKLHKVPIICMVSAYGREDLLQESEKAMLDAFLHKPVNQSLLFDTIMGLFGRPSDLAGLAGDEGPRPDETAAAPARLAGARILLVEDNEVNREVAREWLHSGGMSVAEAANGREALEILEREGFDAVLMDIQMPEMDGLETTRRIRADKRLEGLPVIAMTAHALKGDREKGIAAGMDDYITKPIDPADLFRTLDQWVRDIPPGRARSASRPAPEAEGGDAAAFARGLPGLDTGLGLYRANAKPRLYLRLLTSFLKDFAPAAEELRAQLERQDFDGVRRLAHSLKGVAGNIGAMELSAAAAAVEHLAGEESLAPDQGPWRDLLAALGTVVAGLEAELPGIARDLEPAAGEEAPAALLEGPELAGRLRELARALDDDVAAASALLGELRESLARAAGDEAARRIAAGIDEFDIDAAAEAVQDVLRRLES